MVLIGETRAEAPAAVASRGARRPREPPPCGRPGRPRPAVYACADRSAFNAPWRWPRVACATERQERLETYAQVRSDDLVDALRVRRLRAARPDSVTMDFFAVDDSAARMLIARTRWAGDAGPGRIRPPPGGAAGDRARPASAPEPRTIIIRTTATADLVNAEAARLDARAAGGLAARPGGRWRRAGLRQLADRMRASRSSCGSAAPTTATWCLPAAAVPRSGRRSTPPPR